MQTLEDRGNPRFSSLGVHADPLKVAIGRHEMGEREKIASYLGERASQLTDNRQKAAMLEVAVNILNGTVPMSEIDNA